MEYRIIAVDDEQDFLESVRRALLTSGFRNVRIERDPQKLVSELAQGETFDLALLDLTMPSMSGVELLETFKKISPETECIMLTATDEARVAVDCLKKGAYDYLVKPVSKEDLVTTVHRALERTRLLNLASLGKSGVLPALNHPEAFAPIVTASPKMLRTMKEAELHAASDVPVLITGESGTGKDLLARAIHSSSPRAALPFVPVNMASLNPNLFDAEFFGHTKGAFTGAAQDRTGYLEYANRGTLFLDEISLLPMELQGKLLRVLQDGQFMKLGSSRTQGTNARYIAATNADLQKLVTGNLFRKDLFYRLRGAWLHLPPLRQRKEDLPLLVDNFLKAFCRPGDLCRMEEEAMQRLMGYAFPGNIRELKAILQSAVNLAEGRSIGVGALPDYLRSRSGAGDALPGDPAPVVPLNVVEKTHILDTYRRTGENKAQTARLLGIGLNTLRRKLSNYGVE